MFIQFDEMPSHSRVWVYQSNQVLDERTQTIILERLKSFIQGWDSHGQMLKGSAKILHDLFLVVAVDESYGGVSGCSIDKSVHFLKELGNELQLDFFDRSKQAFVKNESILLENFRNLKTHIGVGLIKKETPTFNNTISTIEELQTAWQVPAGESWMSRYFQ
jgi:hypothetical protein